MRFKRMLARAVLILSILSGGAIAVSSTAGALPCATGDWHSGFAMETYQQGYGSGSGPFFYSPVNGHYYLLVPRSTFEASWGATINPPASRFDAWMGFPCSGPSGNQYGPGDIIYPWGNSGGVDYTKFDMALVDFGTSQFPGAPTDIVHNYCHPFPGCEGMFGGTPKSVGTALGQGTAMNNIANVAGGAYVGMPVCTSGPWGGTSCATVSSASLSQYNGYSTWVWNTTGGSNCKSGAGAASGALASDHGSPTYFSNGNNQVTMSGMVITHTNQTTQIGSNACWQNGQRYGDFSFVPWTSVDAGFPGYSLAPMI